jgi:hypothetical protein
MEASDFRAITEQTAFHPNIIRTNHGREYPSTHRANAQISEAYPSAVVVAV